MRGRMHLENHIQEIYAFDAWRNNVPVSPANAGERGGHGSGHLQRQEETITFKGGKNDTVTGRYIREAKVSKIDGGSFEIRHNQGSRNKTYAKLKFSKVEDENHFKVLCEDKKDPSKLCGGTTFVQYGYKKYDCHRQVGRNYVRNRSKHNDYCRVGQILEENGECSDHDAIRMVFLWWPHNFKNFMWVPIKCLDCDVTIDVSERRRLQGTTPHKRRGTPIERLAVELGILSPKEELED